MLIITFERCWKDDFVTAPYYFILFPVFMLSLANRLLHLAQTQNWIALFNPAFTLFKDAQTSNHNSALVIATT